MHFYPRSPCGERPDIRPANLSSISISIHALLAESDALSQSSAKSTPEISIHALLAESDPPRGGYCYLDNIISIHALLAESDSPFCFLWCRFRYFYPRSPCGERPSWFARLASHSYFYPRSPCGERPYIMTTIICTVSFLSTLSLRRATRTL